MTRRSIISAFARTRRRERLRPSKQAFKVVSRLVTNAFQYGVESALTQCRWNPAMHEFRQHGQLRSIRGKPAFRMARRNAHAVVDGAIEDRRVPQELGVFALEMPHLLNHIDSLRRIQHFEK